MSSSFTVKQIDDMGVINGGIVKLAAAELGIESFGMQVLDFPPNFEHYPEHDHSEGQMEEVYVVLRGSGEWTVDGEQVPVDESTILRVGAEAKRRLTPGPDGIRVLAIGCTLGKPYERPQSFELASQA